MPFYGPPSEEEVEEISVGRWRKPVSFKNQLYERRLKERYGVGPHGPEEDIHLYECLREDIEEHRARIRRLEKQLHGLEEMRDWLEPSYRDGLEYVAEDEMERILDAVPEAISDGEGHDLE